jgi:ribokinase
MPRVVVIGSINVDLVATVPRFPQPGETVLGDGLARFPGGKGANQAVAAARLGAHTTLVGAVGDDEAGRFMLDFLAANDVDTVRVVRRDGVPTGTALIALAHGENQIIVVPGANGLVSPAEVSALELGLGDVVLCQLEVPVTTVAAVLELARRGGATAILNAAPALAQARPLAARCHLLVVNETELGTLAGASIGADAPGHVIATQADALRGPAGPTIVATLGARGALVCTESTWFEEPGRPVPVLDTTGAGDCFVGALAAALSFGASLREAVRFANAAASIAVQRAGAGSSMPTRGEVESVLAG